MTLEYRVTARRIGSHGAKTGAKAACLVLDAALATLSTARREPNPDLTP